MSHYTDEYPSVALRNMSTHTGLELLAKHGIISDLQRRDDVSSLDQPRKPGYWFTVTSTDYRFEGTTGQARAEMIRLQQNLNIVLADRRGIQTTTGERVFWPGDELPRGAWVMGRDRRPWQVPQQLMTVSHRQPDPLVEVLIPDYDRLSREGWVRRQARQELSAAENREDAS